MLRFTTVHTGRPGAPYYSTIFSGGSTAGEAVAGATAILDFWTDLQGFITAGLSSQVASEVDQVDPATGLVVDTFPVSVGASNSTGNAPLPPATQGLIRLRTATFIAGRRVLGHIFVPSLANDSQLVGEPSAAFLAGAQTAANDLATAMSPAGDLVVYSRTHLQAATVTSTSVWDRFAVLRSRRD